MVVIAGDQQDLPAVDHDLIRLSRDVDFEVLRAFQRTQKRSGHVQVVVIAAGEYGQH
jgi:hypothetical protein